MSLIRFFENEPFMPALTLDATDFMGWPSRGQMVTTSSTSWAPRCDVVESDKEIRISAEFPGVPKEDIHIAVDETTHMLKLDAQLHRETKQDGETWHKTERRYGYFRRAFQLPRGVQADDIKASVENGVLTVTIPKPDDKPAVQGPKRIAIA